mmetsp:Transcript_3128/g.11671  ORF Transcript_3128/g.11671 Transcript_3128/m.11671 type:complete len:336 (-) Transcript_3128:4815-5822(-)
MCSLASSTSPRCTARMARKKSTSVARPMAPRPASSSIEFICALRAESRNALDVSSPRPMIPPRNTLSSTGFKNLALPARPPNPPPFPLGPDGNDAALASASASEYVSIRPQSPRCHAACVASGAILPRNTASPPAPTPPAPGAPTPALSSHSLAQSLASCSHSASAARQRICPSVASRRASSAACAVARFITIDARVSSLFDPKPKPPRFSPKLGPRLGGCAVGFRPPELVEEALPWESRLRASSPTAALVGFPARSTPASLSVASAALAFRACASSASSHRPSFSYHPSFMSSLRCACAYTNTPIAASGSWSWLLMAMIASTHPAGLETNSVSL